LSHRATVSNADDVEGSCTRSPRNGSILRVRGIQILDPRSGARRQGHQSLIARGGSKTVSITVQTPPADRPCNGAGRVCVEIYSISADRARGVAVAIFVGGYALVADRTRRPAVAVAISVQSSRSFHRSGRPIVLPLPTGVAMVRRMRLTEDL
jgi:hypothetical protein